MSGIKVAICIPSGDDWKALFALCLLELRQHVTKTLPDVETVVLSQRGCSVHTNRELLARMALKHGATHVLFLDPDQVFPADLLNRLLAHDLPIVGALYPQRRSLHPPSNTLDASAQRWVPPGGGEQLQPVHFTGTGLLLVKCEVFRTIPEPWFDVRYIPQAGGFECEDGAFNRVARDAGFGIHVDTSMWDCIGHIGAHVFSFLADTDSHGFLSRLPATARCNETHNAVIAGKPRAKPI